MKNLNCISAKNKSINNHNFVQILGKLDCFILQYFKILFFTNKISLEKKIEK